MVALVLPIFLLCHSAVGSPLSRAAPPLSFELRKSWANYSPWYPVGEYAPAPDGCEITQVNIIQRHGARYPTEKASVKISKSLTKLLSVKEYTDPSLEFLKTYKYGLGAADLVPFGAQESLDAGKVQFDRYKHLVCQEKLPFIRASGSGRVIDSATNWTEGFFIASNFLYRPKLDLILPENLNDTLDDGMCPNAGDADDQEDEWVAIFGKPIAARLNKQAPGANIKPKDIPHFMSLCSFESVAQSTGTLGHSPFCDLFSEAEFEQYEYYGDLGTYYKTGHGQELGPVQGVGYINELLARLTGQPVRDNTQTNRTLNADPTTFPLNRTFYADFSHDDLMIAIYSAMGLFRQQAPLDPSQPDPKRTWVVSQMTPFGGRLVTEKLLCNQKEHVRVFVNDALQPLEFCGANAGGLCTLDEFVKSQDYARNDGHGDFEKCHS